MGFFREGSPAARLVAWLSEEGRSGPPPAEFQGQLSSTDDFGGFAKSGGYTVRKRPPVQNSQPVSVDKSLPGSPAAMNHVQSRLGPASFVNMRGDVEYTPGATPMSTPAAGSPAMSQPMGPLGMGLGDNLSAMGIDLQNMPNTAPQAQVTTPEAVAAPGLSQQDKAMGEMTFATGLNMLAKASTMPDFRGMLGGMGATIAGMAQMSGKGGKWAMPVAMLSTLTYLKGERESQNMQVKRNVRLANAYGRALAAAGGNYGK